ncbi:AIPR family protein [Nocardiopsis synnemataformans]|uniref:AIPR family protein n=1 Tax=Nocardiopsis synnemataformans TaxID=61305 RepID=UPI003EBD500F
MNSKLIPLPVNRIRNFLLRTYADLIDMSDVPQRTKPTDREQMLLSRALAALAVSDTLGCTAEEAAALVTDGGEDWGIDSIGVDERPEVPTLLINQSKWSDDASGKFRQGDVDRLRRGIVYLHNGRFDEFNARMRPHADHVHKVLQTPRAPVILMLTVMRWKDKPLDGSVIKLLEELRDEMGGPGVVDLRVRYLEDIEEMYERAWSSSDIRVKPRLDSFVRDEKGPQEAYYGTLPATELAAWFRRYGTRLFDENVRRPLGTTTVNSRIVNTLLETPEDFFYHNNGVAVLCDTVDPAPGARMNAGGVLELRGVQVVNGAQTIASIARAMETSPEQVANATVGIKIICLEGSPEGFGATVTRAMNTQNAMVLQDYVALDEKQQRLAMDFLDHLNKEYVLQRGSAPPATEDAGCLVSEAAEALACADEDAGVTAHARKDPEALWDTEADGLYRRLFGGTLKAETVWKQVCLLRVIRKRLARERENRADKAALIAEHGVSLCAHVVFQQLRERWASDSSLGQEWEAVLSEAEELAPRVLDLVIHHHGELYSMPVATLKNPDRCRVLAAHVYAGLNGTEPVVLREEDQPRKRSENAVTVLHRSGRIPDGARLELWGDTAEERRVLVPWVEEDPRRGLATWVARGGNKCIRWEFDGRRYSATGLVQHILRESDADELVRALQGTRYWYVQYGQGEINLVELAEEVRRVEASGEEEPEEL